MMLKKRIKFSHILVEIIKSVEILPLIRASKFCWLPCFKYLGLRTPRPNLCYFFPISLCSNGIVQFYIEVYVKAQKQKSVSLTY